MAYFSKIEECKQDGYLQNSQLCKFYFQVISLSMPSLLVKLPFVLLFLQKRNKGLCSFLVNNLKLFPEHHGLLTDAYIWPQSWSYGSIARLTRIHPASDQCYCYQMAKLIISYVRPWKFVQNKRNERQRISWIVKAKRSFDILSL